MQQPRARVRRRRRRDRGRQGEDEFKAGRWAFLIQGAWKLADFRADIGFRFSLSPIPAGAAGSEPVAVTFVGTGWAVNAGARRPGLAREYVRFMAEPGNARLYCEEAEGAFSTLVGGTTTLPAEASALVTAFDASRWAGSPAQGLDCPGAEEVMGAALQEVFPVPAPRPGTCSPPATGCPCGGGGMLRTRTALALVAPAVVVIGYVWAQVCSPVGG
ncbi:hypothetical protein, partial [Actinosynnema sp.]|uniref:hypothetical protein n=1 Tax=Actinosynnema sp. TaxID=1872144 RepID=UPI003F8768AD